MQADTDPSLVGAWACIYAAECGVAHLPSWNMGPQGSLVQPLRDMT